MKIRLIRPIAVLIVLLCLAQAEGAPGNPEPQAGFDFSKDAEVVFQNKIRTLCNQLDAFSSKVAPLSSYGLLKSDQMASLASELNSLMFVPQDDPSLSFLNTSDFRNLRTRSVSFLQTTRFLFMHAGILGNLRLIRDTWRSSLLGLQNMSQDLELIDHIVKKAEDMIKNNSRLNTRHWLTDRTPGRSDARKDFLADLLNCYPYAKYMRYGGRLDYKVLNQACAIEVYAMRAHERRKQIADVLLPQYAAWVEQYNALRSVWTGYKGNDEVLKNIMGMISDTMTRLEKAVETAFTEEERLVNRFIQDELPPEAAVSGLGKRVHNISETVAAYYKITKE